MASRHIKYVPACEYLTETKNLCFEQSQKGKQWGTSSLSQFLKPSPVYRQCKAHLQITARLNTSEKQEGQEGKTLLLLFRGSKD